MGSQAGRPTGGEFKPINTSVDGLQISEYMPLMAKEMKHLAVVRSMSTKEADHNRGRYYMHTGYVPNPNIEYPELWLGGQPTSLARRCRNSKSRRSSPSAAAAKALASWE